MPGVEEFIWRVIATLKPPHDLLDFCLTVIGREIRHRSTKKNRPHPHWRIRAVNFVLRLFYRISRLVSNASRPASALPSTLNFQLSDYSYRGAFQPSDPTQCRLTTCWKQRTPCGRRSFGQSTHPWNSCARPCTHSLNLQGRPKAISSLKKQTSGVEWRRWNFARQSQK